MKFNKFLFTFIFSILFFMSMAQSNKALDSKQQSIISIASFTALGDSEQLKPALIQGLESGLSVNEIKEILVHLYAYCGFPRSISGLQTFLIVLDGRKANGIIDNWGKEASYISESRNKYERGKDILEALTHTKIGNTKPPYQQFSPEIDVFLKEHLFADIFERDVLTYMQRELATVSALITLGNVDPMLRGHLNISMLQGVSPEQLQETINQLKSKVSQANIDSAQSVLNELTKIARTNQKTMSPKEEIINLSNQKWQWMADKNIGQLAALFHGKAKFVHMGGTWGTERELQVIENGTIWYKKADIHETSVEFFATDTAIVWNHITMLSEVKGNEVSNPFMVTEVYKKENNQWRLINLTFSKLLN